MNAGPRGPDDVVGMFVVGQRDVDGVDLAAAQVVVVLVVAERRRDAVFAFQRAQLRLVLGEDRAQLAAVSFLEAGQHRPLREVSLPDDGEPHRLAAALASALSTPTCHGNPT